MAATTKTSKSTTKTTTRKTTTKTTAKTEPAKIEVSEVKQVLSSFKPSVLDFESATKAQFDKELKRIASNKCNAKSRAKRAEADGKTVEAEINWDDYYSNIADYDRVKAAKDKRFPGRKTYMDYTEEEIQALNLKQTLAGIASLACTRSRYPHRADEALRQERIFAAHRDELNGKASAKEALKQMSAEEIEALLAELK